MISKICQIYNGELLPLLDTKPKWILPHQQNNLVSKVYLKIEAQLSPMKKSNWVVKHNTNHLFIVVDNIWVALNLNALLLFEKDVAEKENSNSKNKALNTSIPIVHSIMVSKFPKTRFIWLYWTRNLNRSYNISQKALFSKFTQNFCNALISKVIGYLKSNNWTVKYDGDYEQNTSPAVRSIVV
ncbi:hypothetical protein TNIN_345861 [Trichonephila inaurata madagascariensis]|uniref:Uncharacterized protein n=1 Tax=Trichonephila inaurata madagascariensis TaxID=2747483 RepID=A0A8X6YTE0_9ARAC|nr:hypothetical protein TNIN_345861 [Trichonephila inaurata madagascariensis]